MHLRSGFARSAIVLSALLAVLTLAPVASSASVSYPSVPLLLWTINEERSTFHVGTLQLDRRLCRIAAQHAVDMVQHNYFSHRSLTGLSPLARMAAHHHRLAYAGENLALDTDPISASAALWHSTDHRRNLLEPHYKHVGIAAVARSDGEVVIVEDFTD